MRASMAIPGSVPSPARARTQIITCMHVASPVRARLSTDALRSAQLARPMAMRPTSHTVHIHHRAPRAARLAGTGHSHGNWRAR
eukprot:666535-Prymnesium_polylepis.1